MNTTNMDFDFVTDTSTLCVYDVATLTHRFDDECDWWSIPEEELLEVNRGNVAFVGLGGDGRFSVALSFSKRIADDGVAIRLTCPSGRLFFGAAEEVTADGLEPEAVHGGTFLTVEPGVYLLMISRTSGNELACSLERCDGDAVNQFSDLVRLP